MAEEEKQKVGKAAEQEEIVDSQKVEDIRAESRLEFAKEIEDMTPDQFHKAFGELYAKVANDLLDQHRDKDIKKSHGFLLEAEDPYARGVERVFVQNAGVGVRVVVRKLEKSRLPMILPFKDPATKTALESYLFRAEGAGDTERSQRVKAALQKCK